MLFRSIEWYRDADTIRTKYFEKNSWLWCERVATRQPDGRLKEAYRYYHENKQLRAVGDTLGDQAIGSWTHYFDNGNKDCAGGFLDNEYHGHWTHWYRNGQKFCEQNWVNGVSDGELTIWAEDGTVIAQGTLKEGKCWDGTFRIPNAESPADQDSDAPTPESFRIERYSDGEIVR